MKILFILPINMISGGTFVTYTQAHALKERGHDVSIAFLHDPKNIEVHGFPHFSLRTMAFSKLVGTQEEFDIAISTFWECWYYLGDVRAKHLLSFVQSDERNFYAHPLACERILVEQTYRESRVPIITEARWIESMLKGLGHARISYAPNGINIEQFSPHGPLRFEKSSQVRVLIEGPGGVSFKRVDFAFQVASELDCEIVYVSTDGVVKLEWQRLASYVEVQVPFQEMPAIYRSCDILLKLSVVEGFFGPPLEMMACGGACVVTRVMGFDEYIRPDENALVVAMDDFDAAKSALRRLIEDKSLRESIIKEGLQTAASMQWKDRTSFFSDAVLNLTQKSAPVTDQFSYELRLKRILKENFLLTQKQERQLNFFRRITRVIQKIKKYLFRK
jgi:glycosyltransferase involved in cell wall biosynthesis